LLLSFVVKIHSLIYILKPSNAALGYRREFVGLSLRLKP
jgi:hypothetical protein